MDSLEANEDELRDLDDDSSTFRRRRSLCRSICAVAFAVLIVLLLSFSAMYLAVLVGNLSFWSPISVQSRCKIVSSSVDLRSSKVCELGLLNYKAKHVFYPFEGKKYRCHYDYYWASIFEVEYIDHSGQARFALAEAPNEALPDNCRPSFGAAWLTKDKFKVGMEPLGMNDKVNETYKCWYTLGISKVNIYNEGLFNCQAEDPSTVEMLKRYFILFTRLTRTWISSPGSVFLWRWDVIAGSITGFIISMLSANLIRVLSPLIYTIRRLIASWTSTSYPGTRFLKRACLFAVYFSIVSWVTIQYMKRLGCLH